MITQLHHMYRLGFIISHAALLHGCLAFELMVIDSESNRARADQGRAR